ncbi:hypothetical protein [Sutcliffiella halmapala]|uniref:hypothetical protein n=1 Tax=Sutcliffiella halmapala TaxID=79882 RepID=UPI000995D994|nr:hypothetical protein [Sutcliffiella halmapala]
MFKDIKSRNKPFVILQFMLFFSGLVLGGVGVYTENTHFLGWMFWLVSGAFLLRGFEVWLTRKQRYIGYLVLGFLYLCVSLFFYPVW